MEKIKYTIAYDVATNITGWAIYKNGEYLRSGIINTAFKVHLNCQTDNFKIQDNGTLVCNTCKKNIKEYAIKPKQFKNYGDKLIQGSAEIAYATTKILYQELKQYTKDKDNPKYSIEWEILAEVSEHGNRSVSNKLWAFTGIYISQTTRVIQIALPKCGVIKGKIVQPRQWQLRLFGFESDTSRLDGKEMSIERAKKISGKTIMTDDEADAINIASVAPELKDYYYVKKQNISTTKEMAKLRRQLPIQQAMIKKYEIIANTKKQTSIKKATDKTKYQNKESIEFLTKAETKVYTNAKTKADEIKRDLNIYTDKIFKEKK